MAGYLFSIGSKTTDPIEVIRECAASGFYSTKLGSLSPTVFEGTLADYISMKPGDNVYFFCQRKIYGIGELVNVGPDCKYSNFPGACALKGYSATALNSQFLVDKGNDSNLYRWLCLFKGAPYFFEDGIDIDEILRYKPNTFKMLRAFWKLSFVKIDDEENQSLKEIVLLRHQTNIAKKEAIMTESNSFHDFLRKKDLKPYLISIEDMLGTVTDGSKVKHEYALEANVVYDLIHDRISHLGHWDYVARQVIASPFKPIDYIDKIDVFANKYLDVSGTKIVSNYLVTELKKDKASIETIDQVMKYVDGVCTEYAYGDYGAIKACIIAAEFSEDMSDYLEKYGKRQYMLGSHPAVNKSWSDIILLKYEYSGGKIIYKMANPYEKLIP